MRTVLLISLLFVSAFQAVMGEVEGDWTYSVENNQATITDYNGAGGALVIPSSVGGYAVVNIGTYAFNGKTSITSITIPNSVTSIGNSAFSGCTGLTGTLTIPNSVTSFGNSAFFGCTSLSTITIPSSVTSIGDGAFYGCIGLTEFFVHPDNLNYCSEDGVLFNKTKTNLITCPGGKTGAYTIPNSVTSIELSAFYNCTGLTSVKIPNSVTSIGNYAFSRCIGLTGTLTIPNSVTTIGDGAFSGCTGLTGTLTIPNSVTSIGYNAFGGCTSLSTITIPNSVTSIGYNAFYKCTGLTGTLTIPSSVTSIGDGAFYGCIGLTEFFVHPDNLNYCSEDGVLFNKTKTNLITCPGGKTGAYTIPNSVTSIYYSSFQFCVSLASIIIPSSVTSIARAAFTECPGLTEILVHPDNPTYSSEDGVLYDKLKTNLIKFPAGKAGAYTIPSSVTKIGGYAFYYCDRLTSVTIPESVTSISNEDVVWRNGFMGCTSLTAISVDSDNPNYCSEDGVLFNKTKTTLITCPGGKIGTYTIPSSVTNIEQRAFRFCVSLAGIIIPNSVTSIPLYAFDGCAKLTNIVIPSSVTSIGGSAFNSCNSIVNIFIPNSVTSIAVGAFGTFSYQKSTSLQRVLLPMRFEETYQNFGLTASQVSFYDASSSSFIAGQQSVVSDPIANNLYTSSQYSDNFVLGRNSVLSSPNTHNLYTASQMQTLAFGDLVLTKNANGSFILNYDIEQSTDLQNWSTYAPLSMPLTGLPADKAFVRIKAKQ